MCLIRHVSLSLRIRRYSSTAVCFLFIPERGRGQDSRGRGPAAIPVLRRHLRVQQLRQLPQRGPLDDGGNRDHQPHVLQQGRGQLCQQEGVPPEVEEVGGMLNRGLFHLEQARPQSRYRPTSLYVIIVPRLVRVWSGEGRG